MPSPSADDFLFIRNRRLEIAFEALKSRLGREVKYQGTNSDHCDFCQASPDKGCTIACSTALDIWKAHQL